MRARSELIRTSIFFAKCSGWLVACAASKEAFDRDLAVQTHEDVALAVAAFTAASGFFLFAQLTRILWRLRIVRAEAV